MKKIKGPAERLLKLRINKIFLNSCPLLAQLVEHATVVLTIVVIALSLVRFRQRGFFELLSTNIVNLCAWNFYFLSVLIA